MAFAGTMTPDLELPSSIAFKQKSSEIEEAIMRSLNDTNLGRVKVVKFMTGSLIATLNFMVSPTSLFYDVTASSLTGSLNSAIRNDAELKSMLMPGAIAAIGKLCDGKQTCRCFSFIFSLFFVIILLWDFNR